MAKLEIIGKTKNVNKAELCIPLQYKIKCNHDTGNPERVIAEYLVYADQAAKDSGQKPTIANFSITDTTEINKLIKGVDKLNDYITANPGVLFDSGTVNPTILKTK